MKILIVYYSRTGTAKAIASVLASRLKCDIEEIVDKTDRKGVIGYLKSGKDAVFNNLTDIETPSKNPNDYDLIIIGTPIWSFNMSSAIRTYIHQNKSLFQKVAFFCVMGGSGDKYVFKKMKELIGKEPKAVLSLRTKEVLNNHFEEKLKDFEKKLT